MCCTVLTHLQCVNIIFTHLESWGEKSVVGVCPQTRSWMMREGLNRANPTSSVPQLSPPSSPSLINTSHIHGLVTPCPATWLTYLREGVQKKTFFWVGGVTDSQTRSKPLKTSPNHLENHLFRPKFHLLFSESFGISDLNNSNVVLINFLFALPNLCRECPLSSHQACPTTLLALI